eukprot:5815815-Pleurochrysis_carterae.AAC.1
MQQSQAHADQDRATTVPNSTAAAEKAAATQADASSRPMADAKPGQICNCWLLLVIDRPQSTKPRRSLQRSLRVAPVSTLRRRAQTLGARAERAGQGGWRRAAR